MATIQKTLVLSVLALNLAGTLAYGAPSCKGLFADIKESSSKVSAAPLRLTSFELESGSLSSSNQSKNPADLQKDIAAELAKLFSFKGSESASLEIMALKDGNLMVIGRGLSPQNMARLEEKMKGHESLQRLLKQALMNHLDSKLTFKNDSSQPPLTLSKKSLPGPIAPDLATEGAKGVLLFSGKHAYQPFLRSLFALRSGWDVRFPLEAWQKVGLESPFGTAIENGSALVGLKITGIGVDTMNEGKAIIEKPMENVKIWEFSGTVVDIKNINQRGPDPVWSAKIKDDQGKVSEVVLTNALGVRVEKKSNTQNLALSGTEAKAAAERRQRNFADFKNRNQESLSPKFKMSLHDKVDQQLQTLPPEEAARFQSWRQRMLLLLSGQKDGSNLAFPLLKRNGFDLYRRPMKEIQDETMRPIVEETHRLLFDTEGPNGYNKWLVDLATQVALDLHKAGQLRWGSRQSVTRDVNWNYPFAEGKHGIPMENFKLDNVPLITEQNLIQGIDKLAQHYGFDRNISQLPNLKLQAGTKAVGTLEGVSLEESTPFFFEYSRNHVLFLDNYFKGKPHGQYAHIMQWLYLAERYSQPNQNAFGVQILESLFRVQGYFMDDMVPGVTVTDFVTQRAPQNPDHVNNTLQLFFPVD